MAPRDRRRCSCSLSTSEAEAPLSISTVVPVPSLEGSALADPSEMDSNEMGSSGIIILFIL